MSESGVDIRDHRSVTRRSAVPYVVKFLWAPFVDALDVPVLSSLLGPAAGLASAIRKFVLMAAIRAARVLRSDTLPRGLSAGGALLVSTASATQDIVIDAFSRGEPAGGRTGGRDGVLCGGLPRRERSCSSGGSALCGDRLFSALGSTNTAAWTACYIAMAALIFGRRDCEHLLAVEPAESVVVVAAEHAARPCAGQSIQNATFGTALGSFCRLHDPRQGIGRAGVRRVVQARRRLGRRADNAFRSGYRILPHTNWRRSSRASDSERNPARRILPAVWSPRAYPLSVSLWIGGILQTPHDPGLLVTGGGRQGRSHAHLCHYGRELSPAPLAR